MGRETPHLETTPAATLSLLRRILISVESFLGVETAGSTVLLLAAAIGLLWANLSGHTYEALWQASLPADFAGLRFALTDFIATRPLRFWINDCLMSAFFLVVGLELRHEMRYGALSDARIATLPILAALAGVLVPALIFLLLNADPVLRRGWPVPTATDIAFAVGILSRIGKGIPSALRPLLLTLAIVDDVIAIFIIATAYSRGIELGGLALAGVGVLAVWLIQLLKVRHASAYLLPAVLLWFGMLRAGVHPTLAGVVLGMMAPATAASNHLLRKLHPWVAYAIMPLFALANAGVSVQGFSFSTGALVTLESGIVLGLVLGKPLGIVLATTLAVRSGICDLPAGIRWRHLVLLGCLGGIGFTMSIFIANLAFPQPELLRAAKCAVVMASTTAALVSFTVGRWIRDTRGAAQAPEAT
jgi:Na+:H+ antiporter, NhaA family